MTKKENAIWTLIIESEETQNVIHILLELIQKQEICFLLNATRFFRIVS